GRADLDAGRLLAMQARAREMHGPPVGAVADFEGVHAVEPHAQRIDAVRLPIGERRHMSAGVPLLAIYCAGMTADTDVEIDDEAELLLARGGKGGHGYKPSPPPSPASR